MRLVGCVEPVPGWSVGEVQSLTADEAARLLAAHPGALVPLETAPVKVAVAPSLPLLTRST